MSSLPIRLFLKNLLNSVSMTSTSSSVLLDISEARSYAIQANWTGTTPIGNLLIEGSTDGIIFSTIKTLAISGNSGNLIDNENDVAYFYLRVTYSFTSGTGNITVNASGKR